MSISRISALSLPSNIIVFKLSQPLNDSKPIDVTLDGIVTFVKLVQFLNACDSIPSTSYSMPVVGSVVVAGITISPEYLPLEGEVVTSASVVPSA